MNWNITSRLGWLLSGVVLNTIGATTGAWFYFSNAMSGFNTSQQTLSLQMQGLQTALDSEKQFRENKIDQAKADLGTELKNLAIVLQQNTAQLTSLNATIAGMDKRLSESIARQQAFESTVMQRIVYQGPIIASSVDGVIAAWGKAGFDEKFIRPIATQDKNAIEAWKGFIDIGVIVPKQ